MSHEIQSMAYAGEIPWHGLGTYVGDRDVSAAEMIKAAGLDWNVESLPLAAVYASKRAAALGPNGGGEQRLVRDNGHRALVRSDNGMVLGACKGIYVPKQNAERFAFLDQFKADGLRYHTAGALFSGERVWALARVNGDFIVHRRDGSVDPHAAFLYMIGGNDGNTPEILGATDTRIVCWNTLSIALATSQQTQWRIRHTAAMDEKLAQAKDALAGTLEHSKSLAELGSQLDRERIDSREFVRLACALILSESEDPREAREESVEKLRKLTADGAQKRTESVLADLTRAFERGIGNQGQSKYDALNAVTEWIDHQRSRASRGRQSVEQLSRATESAWSGTGADRKARAVKLLTRW